jgi:hypothetical protein
MAASPSGISKPGFHFRTEIFCVFHDFYHEEVSLESISRTFKAAPTIPGAREFENKYGRER